MIDTPRRAQGRATTNRGASRRSGAEAARRRRRVASSDAVIAAYIHDLRHSASLDRRARSV